MQNIISKLAEDELAAMQKLLEGKQELIDLFYSSVEKVPFIKVQGDPFANYESNFFQKFLDYFVKNKLRKHADPSKLDEIIKSGEFSHEKILQAMGSQGISGVMKTFLNKMAEDGDVNAEKVTAFVDLLRARNELEHEEIQYVTQSYKDYLSTQIAISKLKLK